MTEHKDGPEHALRAVFVGVPGEGALPPQAESPLSAALQGPVLASERHPCFPRGRASGGSMADG